MGGIQSAYVHDDGECPICGQTEPHQHTIGAATPLILPSLSSSGEQQGGTDRAYVTEPPTTPTPSPQQANPATVPRKRWGRIIGIGTGIIAIALIVGVTVAYFLFNVRLVMGQDLAQQLVTQLDKNYTRPFTAYCPTALLADGQSIRCTLTDQKTDEVFVTVTVINTKGKVAAGQVRNATTAKSSAPNATEPQPTTPKPAAPEPEPEPADDDDVQAQVEELFYNIQSKEVACNSYLRNPSAAWDIIKANVHSNPDYNLVTQATLAEFLTPLCDEYLSDLYSR